MTLELSLEANEPVDDFAVGIGVFNTDGVCCYGTNTDIERFERDGDEWVRFEVAVEDERDGSDKRETFERPVYRNVIIRGAGGEERRPVVLMEVCFGSVVHEEQFSLEDRSDMIYPVLIGRRTIQHLGVIDVTRTFLNGADCDMDSPVEKHEGQEADDDIGA